ncbi:MAG: adaptor protein MecA [Lachnospiraceae bacterium]|nr:adaptor protein MecA [Lachnospiraceae bacterium]
MKIEKISESQIRCTLNYSDLHARQLSLLELAYGSDKARILFREMIERADSEVGFHVDDIPLMIEAIPLSSDGIILIITKIEDPDELDTRFARFTPGTYEEYQIEFGADTQPAVSAGDILETLSRLLEDSGQKEESVDSLPLFSVFCFTRLDPILEAAAVLRGIYRGANSLYKCPSDRNYYLVVHKSDHTAEEFNKICNVLTEYGQRIRSNPGSEAYYEEHFERLTGPKALQHLAV